YDLVRSVYGESTLTRWEDLNGRWAVPGTTYGQSILSMFRAILNE
ncbi:MAG: mannosyl-glycoprotein endo-beta-N-acetylglucosamidase, partial [Selenomonas bovis]|nr:mannosyl-glycoprotein endo-beta-N-acetylglucosamidase [Selenomonas bovis]